MQRRYIYLAAVVLCLTLPARARAQFGGSQIVFDPNMFARQLQQLQQETVTVTNLAQQLQYAIKNTTGGGAGVWQSNQNLLTNLGDLINQQEGLSYTFQGLTQLFQQLYPGYNAMSTAGVQSPQVTVETTLDTLNGALVSAQAQAQNFQTEQATLQNLELKNQTAIGNLQAVQVSNEIALAQAQQVQLLRQLVMAEMNSQNVAAANQVSGSVQSNLAAQAVLSATPPTGVPDWLDATDGPPAGANLIRKESRNETSTEADLVVVGSIDHHRPLSIWLSASAVNERVSNPIFSLPDSYASRLDRWHA